MPGVARVLTHKDVKGRNRINGLVTFPTNKCDGWDRPILCDTKVFQYGDAIAIVCADTKEQALAAADKVKVSYEELPAYMSARLPWPTMQLKSIPARQIFILHRVLLRGKTQNR